MWVPLKNKNKKNTKGARTVTESVERRREIFFLKFSSLYFFLRFTEIGPSELIGPRTKSALRDEGYPWVPKTRDFAENSGKSSENPNF